MRVMPGSEAGRDAFSSTQGPRPHPAKPPQPPPPPPAASPPLRAGASAAAIAAGPAARLRGSLRLSPAAHDDDGCGRSRRPDRFPDRASRRACSGGAGRTTAEWRTAAAGAGRGKGMGEVVVWGGACRPGSNLVFDRPGPTEPGVAAGASVGRFSRAGGLRLDRASRKGRAGVRGGWRTPVARMCVCWVGALGRGGGDL